MIRNLDHSLQNIIYNSFLAQGSFLRSINFFCSFPLIFRKIEASLYSILNIKYITLQIWIEKNSRELKKKREREKSARSQIVTRIISRFTKFQPSKTLFHPRSTVESRFSANIHATPSPRSQPLSV